ncbi:MAG: YjgN family protein [Pseudomonadota bacterium]
MPSERRYAIQFDATGGEYFRIWIVNVALSIITFGIYSAWATVRTRRYFYGKTSLDGTPFQFTAKPVPILIGRVIALAIFGTYSVLGQVNPLWAIGFLFFVIFPLLPWMVVKSQQFRARYTVWRNIPFRFTGTYKEALIVYVGFGVLTIITAGVLLPLLWKYAAKFQFNNLHYGSSKFSFDEETKGFWSTFWIAAGITIGGAFVLSILGSLLGLIGGLGPSISPAGLALTLVMVYGPLFFAAFFVQVRLFNLSLGGTSLEDVGFVPNMRVRGWAWVQLSNVLLLIVTLGIAYPWTLVRSARYKLEHLELVSDTGFNFEGFADRSKVGAAGAEISSDFGFEISLF